VELHSFDDAFVRCLKSGDPAAQEEFTSYFSELLFAKLRARFLPDYIIDELRQETFSRVLSLVRAEEGIRNPERLGALVNSVCDNVLQEHFRRSARFESLDEHPDFVDRAIDLDGSLITWQRQLAVRAVLAELSVKDQQLLRAVFLDEKSKDEVCRELGVDRNYLRVLLHRAKAGFRSHFAKNRLARAAK